MRWYQKFFSTIKAHTPFIAVLRQIISGQVITQTEKQFLEAYKGWVYACVNVKAKEVGNMQLKLMRGMKGDDEEDERVFDHPILDLLNKPNPLMTGSELLEITSSHLDLNGNAFWYFAKDEGGEIREIYPLRPDRTVQEIDQEEPLLIKGYLFTQQAGGQIKLKVDEVMHIKEFSPKAEYPFPSRGMGVVEAAASVIDTDNFARDWNKEFFNNSARPDAVLRTEGNLSDAEKKRLKRMWETEHQGVKKSHRVALLSGGLIYEPVGMTQTEMDFVEQRKFTRDEILAMFRVPKTILGITEDVNRANAEASNFVFALRVLKPTFEKITNTLNEFFVPMFGEDDLFFEFESPVPEDRLAVVNEYALGINKWLNRNDIRRAEGLSDTREGDVFFGTLADLPQDIVKTMKREGYQQKDKKELKPLKDKKIKRAFKEKQPKRLSKVARERYGKLFERAVNAKAERFRRVLDEYFEEQQKRVVQNLKTELEGLEKKEYQYKQLEAFFDKESEIQAGISLMQPFIREFTEDAVEMALLLTGIDTDEIDVNSEEFIKFVDDRARFFSEKINQTTLLKLEQSLAQGFEAGETIEELETRIGSVFLQRGATRELIARTEVSAISNFAAEEAYRQAGIEKKEWLITSPKDIECLQADGEIVNVGEKFSNGFERPPVHPNCVCTIIPIVE